MATVNICTTHCAPPTPHYSLLTGLGQHDVRGGARGVGGTLHGDAHVGLLEGGRVVDAVARHAHRPAAPGGEVVSKVGK